MLIALIVTITTPDSRPYLYSGQIESSHVPLDILISLEARRAAGEIVVGKHSPTYPSC